jgi:UDP-glucose 4-epimerase
MHASELRPCFAAADLHGARVILTGASGFLGLHLAEKLQQVGATVIAVRRPSSTREAPADESVWLDLTDRAAVARELRRIKPDLVYHLGGFVSGDRSAEAMKHAFDGNVLSSANLLFASTDVVPDARVVITTSLDASDPWSGPAMTGSPYGVSKLQVEILAGALQSLQGADVVSARVGLAYGPNDPNEMRLVPMVIRALLDGISPRLSSGKRRCDWIHVSDVAEGLLQMGTSRELHGRSLELGTGKLSSIRRVADTLRRIVQPSVAITYDKALDRPNDQERAADLAATERAIGWTPRFDLQHGLRDTVEWYRNQRGEALHSVSGARRARGITRRAGKAGKTTPRRPRAAA